MSLDDDLGLEDLDGNYQEDSHCRWRTHYLMYIQYFIYSWSDRIWEFGIYYALACLFPYTLVITATFALFTNASTIFLGGQAVNMITNYPRFPFLATATALNKVMMALCFIFVFLLDYIYPLNNIQTINDLPWNNIGFDVLLLLLIIFGCTAQVASLVSVMSVTGDWVPVVTYSSGVSLRPTTEHLKNTIQRIGIATLFLSPFSVGGLLQVISLDKALLVGSTLHILSGIVEIILQKIIYNRFVELSSVKTVGGTLNDIIVEESNNRSPWEIYKSLPFILSSVAHAFLYMTSLTPGAIIINYVVWRQMSVMEVAAFHAIASVISYSTIYNIPTFIIQKLGIAKMGLVSIWTHFIILVVGVLLPLFWLTGISDWFMLGAIILSRVPLWLFTSAYSHIVQETIHIELRRKMIAVMDYKISRSLSLLNFSWAIICVKTTNFPWLASISLFAVLLASIIFSSWYSKKRTQVPTTSQNLNDPEDSELLPMDFIEDSYE